MVRLRDTSAMIFPDPRHTALTAYSAFPYGCVIIEKVNLSLLCWVSRINTD